VYDDRDDFQNVELHNSVPLDAEEAARCLSADGPLARKNKSFEVRPPQIGLLKSIAATFNANGIGVYEAGTGVGKSFAYLIPSLLWHLKNKERVVISTGTINLQQQLLEKDIPAAQDIVGCAVKTVLIKGRQQYVCLRRLRDAERDLFAGESGELGAIIEWATHTADGSRAALPFMPTESLWGRVNAEFDACMGARCAYRDDCFVAAVKREAADAGLLVVNHSLLFADAEARLSGAGYEGAAVLPPYKRLVFDEAHGIEAAATSFFSAELSRFRLLKQLNRLFRVQRGRVSGLLVGLQALTDGTQDMIEAVSAAIESVKAAAETAESCGMNALGAEHAFRVTPSTEARIAPLLAAFEQTGDSIEQCAALILRGIDRIDEEKREDAAMWETKAVVRRLKECALFCRTFREWGEHSDTVFWLEKRAPRDGNEAAQFPAFVQTPLEIGAKMNVGVFEPAESVVCTSATLRTGATGTDAGFTYWLTRTGALLAGGNRVRAESFPSPFSYHTNVLLLVPDDAPLPSEQAFQPYIEGAICALIDAAQGRTLVLFTSYESLGSACGRAKAAFASSPYAILKQGDDDRARLLDAFRRDRASVLFATDSFWEGIDVPGDSLSQVIIVKLPFAVPSDPVFAARAEALEKAGRNAFMELSVPDAAIRFRQGFGRLLRHSGDRGVVAVLDRRIVEKRYGSVFLESIPRTRRAGGSIRAAAREASRFLAQGAAPP
jgi:ATP-dependent DNA helicase DinG